MIKEADVLEAIAICQGEKNPNANTCRNLAAFYTILDHIQQKPQFDTMISHDSLEGIEYSGESEFASLVRGRSTTDVMALMDELMDTLSVLNPRLYDSVIRKLKER